MAAKAVMSGQHFRESAQLVQMTMYVGLDEAVAAVQAPSPASAALPIHPITPVVARKTRQGSGALGDVIPKAGLADQGNDTRDELPSTFLPSSEMKPAAVPVSEPDSQVLNGVPNTGLPIRLRLYVDKHGVVKDIHVLQADEMDGLAVERLEAMFYATVFVPAQRKGVDMSSYMDIEVNVTDFTGVTPTPVAPVR